MASSRSQSRITIELLNAMSAGEFARVLENIFERSSWVPELASCLRPFKTVDELHQGLCLVLREADHSKKLELIRAHPELARPGQKLTSASESEQSFASLDRLAHDENQLFADLNRRYRSRFGFPFVICVKDHDYRSILENFQRRLNNSPDVEVESAIEEVCRIAYFRLQTLTG